MLEYSFLEVIILFYKDKLSIIVFSFFLITWLSYGVDSFKEFLVNFLSKTLGRFVPKLYNYIEVYFNNLETVLFVAFALVFIVLATYFKKGGRKR